MEILGGSIHKSMQTSLGTYPQVVINFENWKQVDKIRKQNNTKKKPILRQISIETARLFHNLLMK